jgi:hypothetical protein
MFELLNTSSHAVKYETATALTTFTQNPTAVKGMIFKIPIYLFASDYHSLAAASCFIHLAIK